MTGKRKNILLAIAGLILVPVSLSIGSVQLTLQETMNALFGKGAENIIFIIQELRLPRTLLGLMVGATLGLTGAALQGVLRNPLADPGILGVSSAATLGAIIAIHTGIAAVSIVYLPVFAMAGALFATIILLLAASRDSSILMIILIGVGLGSLSTASVSLVMNLTQNPMTLRDMMMWLLGSLENRTFDDIKLALPFLLIGWLLIAGSSTGLNALSLGEDVAHSMGINIRQLKQRVIIGAAISVGAAVAVCGAIGFVGLIVPHIARRLITNEPGKILLPSALGGAILLTIADIITRLPASGTPLRLGVVTALIGAPAFLYIIFKTREAMR